MTLWKFFCEEASYPGMWQRWFLNQCVGVGWGRIYGPQYSLDGETNDHGWNKVRNALKRIEIGDQIVVALKDRRLGRIGDVIDKQIDDDQWNPLVPKVGGIKELQ